jgi:dienelactone hydrolase
MTPIDPLLITEEFTEKVGDETIQIEINRPNADAPIGVFSLHGAGPSNRVRANYLANWFGEKFGLGTLRFDYSGHGDSSGTMAGSSLRKRLIETKAVAKHLTGQRLVLIGTSMGAHLASMIANEYEFKNLLLYCPAAYGLEAVDKDFNDEFSAAIRKSDSWSDSPIWDKLKLYSGNASILIGNEDAIIPQGVVENYLRSLKENSELLFHSIESGVHNIHDWLNQNPSKRQRVFEIVQANLKAL